MDGDFDEAADAPLPTSRQALAKDGEEDELALEEDPRRQRSWLTRFSVLNRIASFFEETLADWPDDPDRRLGREVLRKTAVAVRKLESEWENFQTEVQSDVDGLMLLEESEQNVASLAAKAAQAANSARRSSPPSKGLLGIGVVDPSIKRARTQLQAALRVLQREGWRDLEEVLTDAVPPEYHGLVRDVIVRSREEGEAPNATVLRRAIAIASQETQASLRSRVAAARKAIARRRQQMQAATAEIRADVLEIEREIEAAFNELKLEWKRSLDSGELAPGKGSGGAQSYSELREFIEQFFVRSLAPGGTGKRPTLAELRARWRVSASLPAVPARGAREPGAAGRLAAADEDEDAKRRAAPIRVSAASDMRLDGRHVTIVTTASIPWMTGTSVNPLLRASYLAQREGRRNVTLVLPWLEPEDQAAIFPADLRFQSPAEQEAYVRCWAVERGSLPSLDFEIAWYPSAYSKVAGSILPICDVVTQLPEHCNDIVIMEEPEHLTWTHHGTRWNRHFRHVVGIAHTNYIAYAKQFGPSTMAGSWLITSLSVAAYCDVVVKLSDTLQWLPGKCLVRNVHGVRPDFLAIGARRATLEPTAELRKGGYFLGKALWAKGYRELVDFSSTPQYAERLAGVRLTCYGSGPDSAAIRAEAEAKGCPLDFNGAIDHAHESLFGYHVFVNPSVSEVLCTATAEAIAMGKIVVIPEHPSNQFFKTFKNARFFRTPAQFAQQLSEALESAPEPLTPFERYTLSWEVRARARHSLPSTPVKRARRSLPVSSPLSFTPCGTGLHRANALGATGCDRAADRRSRAAEWQHAPGGPAGAQSRVRRALPDGAACVG